MTPREYKEIEGARIAPVLGAIAAVPLAGLISLKAPGAPLFALALGLSAAAYVFWMLADAMYHASCLKVCEGGEYARLRRDAYHFQYGTVGYGAASIFLSMLGFAGHHSTLRLPITVEAGFAIGIGLYAVVIVHVVWSVRERWAIDDMVEAAAARKGVTIAW